jgi:phosphoenolpyruvate-protein kinase (PTS system EI component)
VWQFEDELQEKIARAAAKQENWQWLSTYAEQISLENCADEIAITAYKAEARVLAKQIAEHCMTDAQREAHKEHKGKRLHFGGSGRRFRVMIETPASVLVADELAREVDFFSVGTNDLTQYILACDRQSSDPGRFYDPHHPAVLRALKMAADAAHAAGIWIGVCGELAADPELLSTFLAIGVDELSVAPSAVLPLRMEIRRSIAAESTLDMLKACFSPQRCKNSSKEHPS